MVEAFDGDFDAMNIEDDEHEPASHDMQAFYQTKYKEASDSLTKLIEGDTSARKHVNAVNTDIDEKNNEQDVEEDDGIIAVKEVVTTNQ